MDPSKKALIEKKIIIALLVIFGLSVMYTRARMAARSGPKREEAGISVFDMESAKGKLADFAERKVAYHGASFRNPLKKPVGISALEARGGRPVGMGEAPGYAEPAQGEFVLEGIIWGGKENLAIVSGSVVSEGETVDSARVVRINEYGVILTKGGREIELKR